MDEDTPNPDPAVAELAALKSQLAETATALIAGVPEHLKAIVPTNLSAADQIAWFHSAKATGVFDKPAVPATETPRPTITPVAPDPSTLPAFARMAAGYRK